MNDSDGVQPPVPARTRSRRAAATGLLLVGLLGACSSVSTVNTRAILAQSEAEPEPTTGGWGLKRIGVGAGLILGFVIAAIAS